jgi:hypothetical protein
MVAERMPTADRCLPATGLIIVVKPSCQRHPVPGDSRHSILNLLMEGRADLARA